MLNTDEIPFTNNPIIYIVKRAVIIFELTPKENWEQALKKCI